jgi:hypothetical protein
MLSLLYATDPGSVLGGRPSSGLTRVPSRMTQNAMEMESKSNQLSAVHDDTKTEDKLTGIDSNTGIKTDINSNTDVACRVRQTIAKINAMKQSADANTSYNATGVFPSFAAFRTNKTSTIEDVSKAASENALTTTNNNKHDTKKTLEQIVTEALAVAKTPEDVARYLLSHSHNGKEMTIDSATVLSERNATSSNSIKTEIVPRPEVAYPSVFPPITSFDFEGIMSAASSVTQQSRFTVNEDSITKDALGGSILGSLKLDNYIDIASQQGTERNSQNFYGVSIAENSGQSPMFIRDKELQKVNDKTTLNTSLSGKPPLPQAPAIKPNSDARAVNDSLSVSSIRSMSPLLLMKKKTTTTKKKQKECIRSLSPSFLKNKYIAEKEALEKSDGSTVSSSNSSTSPSPEDIFQPKSTNDNREDNIVTVNCASTELSKSNCTFEVKSVNQIKPINTSTDDDGSVECSIMKEGNTTNSHQFTRSDNVVVLDSATISNEKEEKVVTTLATKRVAHDNQKTVTFSSFDEWHTWDADAFSIDPVGVEYVSDDETESIHDVAKENIETRQMKEVRKKNKIPATSIANDVSVVMGAPASSSSDIEEIVNTSTSSKPKKIASFQNIAERNKQILSSLIDDDVKLYSSAPLQQLDVVPDVGCDISLLSEELEGTKLKIWDEDESVESRISGTNILTKACMTAVDINRRCESSAEEFIFPPASSGKTCKDGVSDTKRKRPVGWTSSAATDNDDDSVGDNNDEDTSIGDVEHSSRFSCGTETQRIKEDLQLLWRDSKSLLQTHKSKSKQTYCGDKMDTPITVTDKQKLFLMKLKALASNIGGVKHGDENMDKPNTAIDKRKLYVEKLKELSLRHV